MKNQKKRKPNLKSQFCIIKDNLILQRFTTLSEAQQVWGDYKIFEIKQVK